MTLRKRDMALTVHIGEYQTTGFPSRDTIWQSAGHCQLYRRLQSFTITL